METDVILVSIVGDIVDTPSIDPSWEIFKTIPDRNEYQWGHYDFFLYANFKAHWINGVNMFSKYGQHGLAHNSCTVCVGVDNTDFSHLIQKFKTMSPNTIVFNEIQRGDPKRIRHHLSHTPSPIPNSFVTSYSSFMKLVSLWKWIDSYKNQPELLDLDDTHSIMIRTMWQRNIQYTSADKKV